MKLESASKLVRSLFSSQFEIGQMFNMILYNIGSCATIYSTIDSLTVVVLNFGNSEVLATNHGKIFSLMKISYFSRGDFLLSLLQQ